MNALNRPAQAAGQLRHYSGGISNLLRLVTANLGDDPHYFALQAVRKLAGTQKLAGIQHAVAAAANRSNLSTLGALLSEDRASLRNTLENQRHRWHEPRYAARLADCAIAAGLWTSAAEILASSVVSRHTARSRARLSWALGDIDEAISTLESSRVSAGRQLAHYRSEREVLTGWEPTLPAGQRHWSIKSAPKLLYVATNSLPHTGSGYAQRTQSLLAALQEDGVETRCATRVGYPLNIGHVFSPDHDTVQSVHYHRLLPAKMNFDMVGRIQQQTQLLADLVSTLQPTVLHTTTDFTNALSVRAVARAFDLPWVYEVRGQLADTWASTRPETSQDSQRYRLFSQREADIAASANAVFTLGEAMRENLQNSGVSPQRITVLPNGVGDDFLKRGLPDETSRAEIREELGLEPTFFYWGTVSSLVDYEGLDLLVRVTAGLARRYPKLRLLIVGDGVEREPLMRLAAELNIEDRCVFTGRVPRHEAPAYHAALDVFAVPRRDLGVTRAVTPLKPVEAMASSVPVMASNLPALAELIEDQVSGVLLKPSDAEVWSDSLEKLIIDPSFRFRLGASGRGFVENYRTWSSCSSKLKRIYSSLSIAN